MSSSKKVFTGKRIVVTRATDQSSELCRRLKSQGATVLEIPLIHTSECIDLETAKDVYAGFASYEWLIFTSQNGVRYFFQHFLKTFTDIRSLGFIRIAAIGQGTAKALAKFHLKPDLMPKKALGEELLKELLKQGSIDNVKLLLVEGNQNRDLVAKKLEEQMAIVDTFQVYKTEHTDLKKHDAASDFREKGADAIIFASSSAVKSSAKQASNLKLAEGAKIPLACSIGPVTSATMKELGIPLDIESEEATIGSIISALEVGLEGL